MIPKLARIEYGFKTWARTMIGAWLGEEEDKNEEENGAAHRVGGMTTWRPWATRCNGVGYRREEIVGRGFERVHRRVRNALKSGQSRTGTWMRPRICLMFPRPAEKLSEACVPVILANSTPTGKAHMDYSLLYMKQMYYPGEAGATGQKDHHHRDRKRGRGVGGGGARLRERAEVLHQRSSRNGRMQKASKCSTSRRLTRRGPLRLAVGAFWDKALRPNWIGLHQCS